LSPPFEGRSDRSSRRFFSGRRGGPCARSRPVVVPYAHSFRESAPGAAIPCADPQSVPAVLKPGTRQNHDVFRGLLFPHVVREGFETDFFVTSAPTFTRFCSIIHSA